MSDPTVWLVEEFGRGGIARYAADVAHMLQSGRRVVVTTTTGGPAEGTRAPSVVWFPRVGPAPLDRVGAAAAGLANGRLRPRPGDVAWVPLGIRPRFEALLVAALRRSGAHLVATVHNRHPHDAARGAERVRATALRCDAVVVHSEELATWARAWGMPLHQLPFPPPDLGGDRPAGVHSRSSLDLPTGGVVVALVGNLKPYKGVEELLAALARLPRDSTVRAVLAGRSDDPTGLRRAVARADGARRVRLIDRYLPPGELLDVLALADAVVLPYRSIDHSGVGWLAVDQALPAVASDLPGLRETFGGGALYCPPGDVGALAAALSQLPARLEALARALPPPPERSAIARSYRRLLDDVLASRAPGGAPPDSEDSA